MVERRKWLYAQAKGLRIAFQLYAGDALFCLPNQIENEKKYNLNFGQDIAPLVEVRPGRGWLIFFLSDRIRGDCHIIRLPQYLHRSGSIKEYSIAVTIYSAHGDYTSHTHRGRS